jgi:hypothetical protein
VIVDCTMFSYEHDALAVRLAELEPVVDAHVVVQATTSFRGDPLEVTDLSGLSDKLVQVVVDFPDILDPWQREKWLRDETVRAAQREFGELVHVLVADADEIPHPDAITLYSGYPITVRNDYREWYADWRAPLQWQPPHQPYIAPITSVHSAHDLRVQMAFFSVGPVGWHLSTLGDAAFASRKVGMYAHSEYDTDYWREVKRLEDTRTDGMDMFERFKLEHTMDLPSTIDRFPHLLGGPIA